jgi:hypothetical protein
MQKLEPMRRASAGTEKNERKVLMPQREPQLEPCSDNGGRQRLKRARRIRAVKRPQGDEKSTRWNSPGLWKISFEGAGNKTL